MKRLIILLAAVLPALCSCNDWLDGVTQTSRVTDATVWQNESSVDSYVNSFYVLLHDYGQFGTAQFGGSLTESLTDTFKYGSVTLGNRAGHSNNYVTNPNAISPDGCLYSIWATGKAYGDIRKLNQFLALQKTYSTFSEEKNVLWEAQVRFFRAFVYFQLARRHGGVILYDTLPDASGRDRSSAEETWQFIADDLDFAARNLPAAYDAADKGRVTQGAAWALKSRAMLYAERWQDAYDAAEQVINSHRYGLVADYAEAWKGGNRESILEFAYDAVNGPNHDFDSHYVPLCDGWENGGRGTPTQEMVECYETADGATVDWTPWHAGMTTVTPPYASLEPRFHATVIYRGCVWKGRTMDCSEDGDNGTYIPWREQATVYGKTVTGYFLRKLLDENHTDIKNVRSNQTWVEIRYAEVLLNKAEAAWHLPGHFADAQEALDQVRSRVSLPPKDLVGDEWFKAYRNERKVELAYEGHLFWDMRRWKLAHTDYNGYRVHGFKINGLSNSYTYVDCDGTDRWFDSKLYVLPVPSEELKNNPSGIRQYDEWL
ncbi:MAG: RagB/SusD family nutrient uptake outer membrane protein [Bacteroidales bacterium]|nr:RagB/SusD family nutrient uptake outer membrane protein [Bacteroidales bacterium]